MKIDPKYLGMLIKLPLNSTEATHSLLVKFLSEIGAQEIRWRGQEEVFDWKVLIY